MRILTAIWLMVVALPSVCQFDPPVKEQYDHMTHKQLFGSYSGIIAYNVDNPGSNPWSGYRYGEQVGYFLEGYLRMYETTRDKAYLVRFINLALKAMAWRNSDFYFTGESVGDNEVGYMDGVMLWPLAHFVHLVLAESNDLAEEVIPDGIITYQTSTVSVNVLPYNSSHTYASLATWFMYRCMETMEARLAAHWSTESAFCHDGGNICAVNKQAGFAGALLYFGHLGTVNSTYSGLLSYLDKGAVLAAMVSGDEPDDRCNCIEGGPVLIPFSNNSYWWHHNALRYKRRNCPFICWGDVGWAVQEVNLENHHEFVEDISHGVIVLVIPTLSNRFGLYTGGSYPFLDEDLIRFRNAFTKHVSIWDGTEWNFKNAVDGSNGPVYHCENCSTYPPEGTFKYASLAWMPLHAYDGSVGAASGPDVYDIVSQFYNAKVFPTPGVLSGGLDHYGVAEVVAAQWEHECFNLTLFNRDLVYDQDFAAKAVLRVDAFGEEGASFADPVITEPRFTVNDGIRSQFRAGAAVVWEPGFEAAYGSIVEAVIDPLGCGMEYKTLAGGAMPLSSARPEAELRELEAMDALRHVQAAPVHQIALAPNPAAGHVAVILDLGASCHVRIDLQDGMGRPVIHTDLGYRDRGRQEHQVVLGGLAPGLYLCIVHLGVGRHTMKLMIE